MKLLSKRRRDKLELPSTDSDFDVPELDLKNVRSLTFIYQQRLLVLFHIYGLHLRNKTKTYLSPINCHAFNVIYITNFKPLASLK
ncbi:CLUMA_CG020603, isoform A [Clunio marinus]|uniref:CLUMA_CG020603, isoform A n=1 Tax=Clunio marinus TaxID=568069 RepID=A0A1J1J5H3_9DIPT|nr:CLUMA_CG020603, isoform A [Clunio marinus]